MLNRESLTEAKTRKISKIDLLLLSDCYSRLFVGLLLTNKIQFEHNLYISPFSGYQPLKLIEILSLPGTFYRELHWINKYIQIIHSLLVQNVFFQLGLIMYAHCLHQWIKYFSLADIKGGGRIEKQPKSNFRNQLFILYVIGYNRKRHLLSNLLDLLLPRCCTLINALCKVILAVG